MKTARNLETDDMYDNDFDSFDDALLVKWSKLGKTVLLDQRGRPKVYPTLPEYAAADIAENGCTMPRVRRVEYSTKPASPNSPAVLATVVFFDDGTKSVVKNCLADEISTETVEVADGVCVEVGDYDSKERGLLYAIMKRIVSSLDADGNVVSGALGNSLRKLIDQSIDQNVIAASKCAAKRCSDAMRREKARREAFDDDQLEKPTRAKSKLDRETLGSKLEQLFEMLKDLRRDGQTDGV